MAQIPLTFLSTAPGELRFALVNKTQVRTAIGHESDVDWLVDQAVASGSAGVGENLLLLSGHLAALETPGSARSPQVTLWWMVSWPDGSRTWQYDVVTRASFASRWGGTPADFEAIEAGRATTFQPARSPVNVTWSEGSAVLPGRLDEVTGDGAERIAWMHGRLEALRAEEHRLEATRIEAARVASDRKAARERELLEPISDEFTSFLERVRTLTYAEIEALDHEVYWSYRGSGLGFGGNFDRITRGRKVVPRNAAALFQVDQVSRAVQHAQPKEPPAAAMRYLRDLACLYAIPEESRRSDPNREAMEDLRDPWRRKVLHDPSVRDVRWWHVALVMFIAACVAFPALALGSAVVIGIIVLFGVGVGLLAWFFLGG